MKHVLLAAFFIVAPLGGCGTPLVGQPIASLAPQASAQAEKSLTIAHLAYNALGRELIAAAESGALRGQSAARAKIYFNQAGDALAVADKINAGLQAGNIVDAISKASEAIFAAKTLIRK